MSRDENPAAAAPIVTELPPVPLRPAREERRRRRRELSLVALAVAGFHFFALLAVLRAVLDDADEAMLAIPITVVELADADADGVARAAALLPRRVDRAAPPPIADPEPIVRPSSGAPAAGALIAIEGGESDADVEGAIVMPVPIDTPRPLATHEATAAGFTGTAALEIVVDSTGAVVGAVLLEPLPHGLGPRALAAVRRWTFQPALYRGQPIELAIRLTVRFRGSGAEAARDAVDLAAPPPLR